MSRIDYDIVIGEEYEVCLKNLELLYHLKDAGILYDVHEVSGNVYIIAQGGYCVAQDGDWIVKQNKKWWTIMPKAYHARIKRANRIRQE